MNAQSLFTTLKKKYQRKKKDLKDSNRPGSSSDVASKAQKAFQTYIFLSWLDDFLQIRQGRNNLPAHTTSDQEFSNELNEESVEEATGNFEEEENDYTDYQYNESQSAVPVVKKSKKAKMGTEKKKNLPQETLMVNMEMSLIRDLSTQVSQPVHLDDNEDLFGRSISAGLRDLPDFERMMAKNEIRNVLFKYLVSAYNKQNPRQGFMAQVPLPSQSNLMNLNFAASANQNQVPLPSQSSLMNLNFAASANQNHGSEVSSRLS